MLALQQNVLCFKFNVTRYASRNCLVDKTSEVTTAPLLTVADDSLRLTLRGCRRAIKKRWTEKNATSLFNAGFEGRRDCDRGVQAVSREDMAGGEAESVRRGSGRDGDLSPGNAAVHDHGCGRFVFTVRQGG